MGRLRQWDWEFEASPGYVVRPCHLHIQKITPRVMVWLFCRSLINFVPNLAAFYYGLYNYFKGLRWFFVPSNISPFTNTSWVYAHFNKDSSFEYSTRISCCFLHYNVTGSWRDDSVIRSICCSCGGPGFGSQHPHGSLQISETPVPGDLTLSSDLCIHQAYT